MTDNSKQSLRIMLNATRKKLDRKIQTEASTHICSQIQSMTQYRKAQRIALYWPIHGEVDLRALWQSAIQDNKICCFPVLGPEFTLKFLPATPSTEFSEQQFGIKEPCVDSQHAILPQDFDIIFLPLLAFDDYGTRLGMGAGYYDRTLRDAGKAQLIGVAYEFQHMSYIKADPWDVPLSAIVTEQRIYLSKPFI